MPKLKNPTKTQLHKMADKVFSDYWRGEIGKCENCGKKEKLQLCHIVTRDIRKLRYERKNTLVLCASCHAHFHNHPVLFTSFIGLVKGKDITDWLIREGQSLAPVNKEFYEYIIKKYKILLKK